MGVSGRGFDVPLPRPAAFSSPDLTPKAQTLRASTRDHLKTTFSSTVARAMKSRPLALSVGGC